MVGIDPSSGLIKKAPFTTICVGAENIPFPDHSFDVVISITSIQNFEDIRRGLSEMKRVGKDCFVLTYLKRSPRKEQIEREIGKLFDVKFRLEEDKDIILFIGKRFK
jgi:ubiquinone/menaquinone biosynthesis C-methylase UbiE